MKTQFRGKSGRRVQVAAALLAAAWFAGAALGVRAPNGRVSAAPAHSPAQQPAPTPSVFIGELRDNRAGCAAASDATLEECSTHDLLWVRSNGLDIRRLMYRTVRIEGFRRSCGSERYIDVQKIEQIDNCDGAAPGPQKTNLSRHRRVVAASSELPDYPKDRITDDDPLTYWYIPSQDGWIYIDLGEALTFNESRLQWAAQHATQYGIYVWDDGYRNWVRVFQSSDGAADETVSFARAFGRYVLLHVARSSGQDGGFALREWQIFGVETPNLALGQELDASSNRPSAGLASDGDATTGWSSDMETDTVHPWIWVRFNSRTRLSEFRLLWDGAGIPGAYYAGFYQDGRVAVWSDRLISSADPRHRLPWRTPIPTDVFLIMVDQMRAPQVKLMEIELFGPDTKPIGQSSAAASPFEAAAAWLDIGGSEWLSPAVREYEGLGGDARGDDRFGVRMDVAGAEGVSIDGSAALPVYAWPTPPDPLSHRNGRGGDSK